MLAQAAPIGATPAPARARYLAPTVTPSCTRPTSTPSSSTPSPVTAIGYFAITRAIRASARLSSTARLVLLVIAAHADNRTCEAWPSIPTIAAECSLTTRTIERTIAALVAAGWLVRDTAAGPWGTNVYRVTPRPDDARPPRDRRPRGRPFADRVTPDAGSGGPPSRVQTTPGAGSGNLLWADLLHEPAVSAPPPSSWPSTHTGVEVDQEGENDTADQAAREAAAVGPRDGGAGVGDVELPEAAEEAQEAAAGVGDVELPEAAEEAQERGAWTPGPVTLAAAVAPRTLPGPARHEAHVEPAADAADVLAALAERPELRALARPPVAALLAAERRPLPVVRRALDELVDAALLAAAAGEPWSASTLARRARAYVRRAYPEPVTSTRPTSTPTPPEPPPEPPRFASSAPYLRGVLAALDTPAPVMPRRGR